MRLISRLVILDKQFKGTDNPASTSRVRTPSKTNYTSTTRCGQILGMTTSLRWSSLRSMTLWTRAGKDMPEIPGREGNWTDYDLIVIVECSV